MKAVTEAMRRITLGHRGEAGSGAWRARAGLGAVVAVCMLVTTLAVTGASSGATGAQFLRPGHWIYNSTLGMVFHVNGGTKSIDQQVPVPGAGPGTQVVETDQNAYVLADGGITAFGKSDLKVNEPLPAPIQEQAVGVEAGSVAYTVYREAGTIQRFGRNPISISTEGTLGRPVVTTTATLWVHNLTTSQLCQLPVDASRLTCTARLPVGHLGSLTLVGDQAVFVDMTAQEMRTVGADGLGRVVPLTGVQLSPASIVAANDVAGRVAILDPKKNVLQLVDASALTTAKPPAKPVLKELGPGRYDQIASSGNGLALIDSTRSTLITLDRDGQQRSNRQIPLPSKDAKAGPGARPALSRGGDSRLYVDSVAGEHTMVVDDDGQVTEVEVRGPAKKPDAPKPTATKPVDPPVTVNPPVVPGKPDPTKPNPNKPDPGKPEQGKPEQGKPDQGKPDQGRPDLPGLPTKPPVDKPDPPKPTVSASRPGAPRGVSATAGTGTAAVSWGTAAANGAAVTSYVVSWSGGSKTVSGSTRKYTATGLTNGKAYVFTVRAVNRVGSGPGASANATPAAAVEPADAVLNLRATPSSGAVTLSWRRPNLNGGKLVRYGISQDGDPRNTTATSYKWTGLKNGTSYLFAVTVVTSGPDGVMTGKITTIRATPKAEQGTLTISQGSRFEGDDENCSGSCYYIHIRVRGFEPNTTYRFQGHTTNYGDLHPGGPEPLKTDSNGDLTLDKFYNNDTGADVYVWMTGPGIARTESNHLTWRD